MDETIYSTISIKIEQVSDSEETTPIKHVAVYLDEVNKADSVKEELATEVQESEPICSLEVPTEDTVKASPEIVLVKPEISVKEEPSWDRLDDDRPSTEDTLATLYNQDLVPPSIFPGYPTAQGAWGTLWHQNPVGSKSLQPPVTLFGPCERDSLDQSTTALTSQPWATTMPSPHTKPEHPAVSKTTRKYTYKPKLPSNLDPADDKFVCDMCNITFIEKERLIRHIAYFHNKSKTYYCDICDKEFSWQSFPYTHMKTHSNEKPYSCGICNKSFACTYYLTRHTRIHREQKPYSCEVCKKQFKERSQLRIHAMIHEGETAKRHSCPDCPMKFIQKYKLTLHQRVHTGILPYVCRLCDSKFSQKTQLDAHTRLHTGEKRFYCELCQKHFVSNFDLVRHQLIHTGIKPYPCDVCGKQFTQKGHLKAHKLTHTGEKPYSCDICSMTFGSRSNLNRHKQSHTREMPDEEYACKICNKQFKQRGRWVKHMESHNGTSEKTAILYSCKVCDKQFKQQGRWKKHEQAHDEAGVIPDILGI